MVAAVEIQAAAPPPTGLAKAPRRAAGRLRVESILDATDRIIAAGGADGLGLPAVAAAAGTSASSLYHFFPTLDALLTALLRRYNALQDQWLARALTADAPYRRWADLLNAQMRAARGFYDHHPVYGELMRRAMASPVLRQADEAHVVEMGRTMAAVFEACFHLPPVPDLERRASLVVMMIDRLWAQLPLEDGRISSFCFEESRRMAESYLANYLPAYLAPKAVAA